MTETGLLFRFELARPNNGWTFYQTHKVAKLGLLEEDVTTVSAFLPAEYQRSNRMFPDSLCAANRGGIFNSSESSTWSNLGFYDLSVNKELGNTGYADYGLDALVLGSTGVKLLSTIIGTVNATDQWLGSFGLGTTPGNFNGKSPISAISALVEEQGAIQSHSYGYTAGAKYRTWKNNTLVPHQLVLQARIERILTLSRTERSPSISNFGRIRQQSLRSTSHHIHSQSKQTTTSIHQLYFSGFWDCLRQLDHSH